MQKPFLQTKPKTSFVVTHWSFALIGINPKAEPSVRLPFVCYALHLAAVTFVVVGLDAVFKNLDDLREDTILVLSLLCQLIIALWKMAIFFYRRQDIQKLIHTFFKWHSEEVLETELETVRRYSAKSHRLHTFYYSAVFLAGLSGALRPIMVKGILYLQGIKYPWETPHKVTFPWDTTSSLGYISAFTWNTLVLYFLLNASTAMDTLFLWFTLNILLQFRILNQRFQAAAAQNQGQSSHICLIRNIKFHSGILDTIKSSDKIFAEIICFKSLVSCGQICFLAYCITIGRNQASVVNLLYLGSFLAAVAMQLFLYCYSGQVITDESILVSDEVFDAFKWQLVDKPTKKMLQMIMLRSQMSSKITGIIFNLDLKLYLWFFKTAASLIGVLKALEE